MTKRVFVMGANSAIAQALVDLCVKSGQEVIAAGRDASVLEALYGKKAGVHIVEVQACDSASVDAAFEALANAGTPVDGYAHCVGSILVAPLTKTTDAQIDNVMQVNLISAMYGLRAFLKQAKSQGQGGAAVLVSTCATGIGVPNHEAIAAAKRLYEKDLITLDDGGYLTPLGRDAAQNVQQLLIILNTVAEPA